MSKFCIFNDRFSSNVGDGIIAECFDYALRHYLPEASLSTVDLNCRTSYKPDSISRHNSANLLLRGARRHAPSWVQRVLSFYRVERRFRAFVMRHSTGADAFIIGGGQLISGRSTFFPHRLATLASVASDLNIPLFIHAVGVSDPDDWDDVSTVYLRRAFGQRDNIRSIATRDSGSALHWTRAFGGDPPRLARDPGLLAAEVYRDALGSRKRRGGKQVGVGVISPDVVDHFGGRSAATVKPSLDFFVDVGTDLIRAGYTPVYFTNGSGEDEAVLEALASQAASDFPALHDRAKFEARPVTPAALVNIIAGLDGLIAHRLHANIVAYALKVPHVGLGWDDKLASFFRSVGRERYLLGASDATEPGVASIVDAAIHEGIADVDHEAVLADTWQALGLLARQLQEASATAGVNGGQAARDRHRLPTA